MARKSITIEYLIAYFNKCNYTLLSTSYNYHKYLYYTCDNGHQHKTLWSNFQKGHRCPSCAKQTKPTLKEINSLAEKVGYTFLSGDYVNNRTKLDFMCDKGHKIKITIASLRKGTKCYVCSKLTVYSFEDVLKYFNSFGYTVLLTNYKNVSTKINYICNNGHVGKITFSNFKQGKRCTECKGNKKHNINTLRKEFCKFGYELLESIYVNAHTKMRYKCPLGHQNFMSYNNFRNGRRCPTCAVINNSGSNNYNWKNGASLRLYCTVWKDSKYKQDLRDRDNNICQNPYCYHTTKKLSIHHIDYNKKNCHPSNLITVCIGCNSRANKDRDWHTKWYQILMEKKYNFRFNKGGV